MAAAAELYCWHQRVLYVSGNDLSDGDGAKWRLEVAEWSLLVAYLAVPIRTNVSHHVPIKAPQNRHRSFVTNPALLTDNDLYWYTVL